MSFKAEKFWMVNKNKQRNPNLNINTANRYEVVKLRNGRITKIYFFKCENQNCKNEIKILAGKFAEPTGFCRSCAAKNIQRIDNKRKKLPFMYLYNNLKSAAKRRNILFNLSFEEFLEFTSHKNCKYCDVELTWLPHHVRKKSSIAYNLDRINNKTGYEKENCVACCSSCNFTRGNRFSYEEFLLLSNGLKKIIANRKNIK